MRADEGKGLSVVATDDMSDEIDEESEEGPRADGGGRAAKMAAHEKSGGGRKPFRRRHLRHQRASLTFITSSVWTATSQKAFTKDQGYSKPQHP